MAHDVVIRGGQIVDGTGNEPVAGDLAIGSALGFPAGFPYSDQLFLQSSLPRADVIHRKLRH